jgi:hypothetical protein
LTGNPEGKTALGRPRHRWIDNSKMDLVEIGWSFGVWIGVAQEKDKWELL